MNNELVGILALIAAEQAGIEAMKLEIAEDAYYQRPARCNADDFWRARQRLEELYVRAVNAG